MIYYRLSTRKTTTICNSITPHITDSLFKIQRMKVLQDGTYVRNFANEYINEQGFSDRNFGLVYLLTGP